MWVVAEEADNNPDTLLDDGNDDDDEADKDENIVIEMKNASFSWDLDGKDIILDDISVKIPFGRSIFYNIIFRQGVSC